MCVNFLQIEIYQNSWELYIFSHNGIYCEELKKKKKDIERIHAGFPTGCCNFHTSVYNSLEICTFLCWKAARTCMLCWIMCSDSIYIIYDELISVKKNEVLPLVCQKYKPHAHVGEENGGRLRDKMWDFAEQKRRQEGSLWQGRRRWIVTSDMRRGQREEVGKGWLSTGQGRAWSHDPEEGAGQQERDLGGCAMGCAHLYRMRMWH